MARHILTGVEFRRWNLQKKTLAPAHFRTFPQKNTASIRRDPLGKNSTSISGGGEVGLIIDVETEPHLHQRNAFFLSDEEQEEYI